MKGAGIQPTATTARPYGNGGTADLAVYRPSTGVFFVLKTGGGAINTRVGAGGDVPVVQRPAYQQVAPL